MRLHTCLFASLLALLALSCQTNTPISPLEEGAPSVGEPSDAAGELPIDPQDEGYRGLTALLTGEMSLNGSVETGPGYTGSPTSVTQPATTGQLALLRLRSQSPGKGLPDTPIYTDVRGPGGAYSSMTILRNYQSYYKALYVLRNEDLSLRVHNRPSYSGPLNEAAAFVDYTYETKPIEDSSEPNDDENTATVTDRTLGKPLGIGATATRSFFEYDASIKDREDWFTTTLQAGAIYRYKLTSYNPRYGTWGYTLKLFNSAGTQVGSTTTIPTGNAGGNLTTPAIATTGTYYIQIVGNPGTKAYGSNLFFSLYTIGLCETVRVGTVNFTPGLGEGMCPGKQGTWGAVIDGAEPTSVVWDFGGGCEPNNPIDFNPLVVLTTTPGTYNGSVKFTTPCGAQTTKTFTYNVECSWGQTFGQALPPDVSVLTPTALAVDPQGRCYVTGNYIGSNVDVSVQNPIYRLESENEGAATSGFLLRMKPDGTTDWALNLAEGNGLCQPLDIKLDDQGRPWVSGFFYNSLDFDLGTGTNILTSAGSSDAFLVRTANFENEVALRFGGTGFDSAESLALDASGYPVLTGYFQNTVDFDPSAGTFNRTAAGSYDAYVLNLFPTGELNEWAGIGGTGSDRAFDLAFAGNDLYVVGAYGGTTDFDPTSGVLNSTSAGGDDAFCVKLNRFSYAAQWLYTYGASGTDRAFNVVIGNAGHPRIGGIFASTVDFDPGPGFQARLAFGGNDAIVVALSSDRVWQWHAWVGSEGAETVHDLAYFPGSMAIGFAGHFTGQARFDSTNAATELPNKLSFDQDGYTYYLLDSNGYGAANQTYGFIGADAVRALGSTGLPLANRYLAGTFQTSIDFDPSVEQTATVGSVGSIDGWLTRHSYTGSYYRP